MLHISPGANMGSVPEIRGTADHTYSPNMQLSGTQMRILPLSLIHPFDKTPISTLIQQTCKCFLRMQVVVFKDLLYHLMK